VQKVRDIIKKNIYLKEKIIKNEPLLSIIDETIELIYNCYKNDGKLLLCGNGGSAADAQHIAAEFTGRFYIDREPLFAEALHVNTSYLTAVANDYSFDETYARLVRAFGKKNDILLGFTTSGNSKNIIKAFEDAKKIGMAKLKN
jgi:D-sedoheptulose 7-phosphate isomerase